MRIAVIALLVLPAALAAQAAPPTCDTPEHHAFDYWVGEWNVFDTTGTKIAESSIKSVAAGCAISENWRPLKGKPGVSISWYQPADQQWHQQWVGGGGWIAWFDGNPVDGAMTMTTKAADARPNAPLTRMIYSQPEPGVVRQSLFASKDGGKTWAPNFVGIYRKK